nr:MAG TPA: hypothetical protein [Bacteriophage sp.]
MERKINLRIKRKISYRIPCSLQVVQDNSKFNSTDNFTFHFERSDPISVAT